MKMLLVLGILAAVIVAVWFKLRGPDIPYANLEAKYADTESRFVDLPGGFHVHYEDQGDSTQPLLVLLHGYGDSYTTWEGWVTAFKNRFRIISLDFPGHGLTRAPENFQLGGDRLADFVDAFAAQLSLPPFAVVGNSMGGGVAWQLALRHPQRVRAMVLVDATGFANDKPPRALPLAFRILGSSWGRALLRHIDNRPLIEAGLKFDVFDKSAITPTLVDRWSEFQRAPGHRAVLMSFNPAAFARATPDALRQIHVPSLILWGESDPLLDPGSARKFAAAIPAAKLVVYPYVGHLPQLEIPQRSAVDVAEFLQTLR